MYDYKFRIIGIILVIVPRYILNPVNIKLDCQKDNKAYVMAFSKDYLLFTRVTAVVNSFMFEVNYPIHKYYYRRVKISIEPPSDPYSCLYDLYYYKQSEVIE